MSLAGVVLPVGVVLTWWGKVTTCHNHEVYRCESSIDGIPAKFILKVKHEWNTELRNERQVLEALESSDIPVPRVLFYREYDEEERTRWGEAGDPSDREYLAIEWVPGKSIYDCIDPESEFFEAEKRIKYWELCGEALARVHSVPLQWAAQGRQKFHNLAPLQRVKDPIIQRIVAWLMLNKCAPRYDAFCHGDFSTTNILFDQGHVTAIIDWEWSGMGWREWEIAWCAHSSGAPQNYDITVRDALWRGYRHISDFDDSEVLWCSVLIHLQIAVPKRIDGDLLLSQHMIHKAWEMIYPKGGS